MLSLCHSLKMMIVVRNQILIKHLLKMDIIVVQARVNVVELGIDVRMAVTGSVKSMVVLGMADPSLPGIRMPRIRMAELARTLDTNRMTGILGVTMAKEELAGTEVHGVTGVTGAEQATEDKEVHMASRVKMGSKLHTVNKVVRAINKGHSIKEVNTTRKVSIPGTVNISRKINVINAVNIPSETNTTTRVNKTPKPSTAKGVNKTTKANANPSAINNLTTNGTIPAAESPPLTPVLPDPQVTIPKTTQTQPTTQLIPKTATLKATKPTPELSAIIGCQNTLVKASH
jgi:hypothetical protein